jgi:hypothetical protein
MGDGAGGELMTMQEFVERYRSDIDDIIRQAIGPLAAIDDDVRIARVENDEFLYRMAVEEGVYREEG